MTKIIVGCPVKNDLESFQQMIESLLRSTISYDKIVLVDGGSTRPIQLAYYEQLKERNSKIEVYYLNTKTPLEAYNYLFRLAKEEKADLFLTQTDVVFPKLYKRDWLQIMSEVSKELNIGAVTCIGGGGTSGPDYVDGFNWLGGWCTYYPYSTIKKIGGFDESFPNGFGVDIDHSYRIHKAGLKIVQINYWVDHHQQNSREHDNSPKAEEMKKASSEYFRKKWNLGEYTVMIDEEGWSQ